MLRNKLVRSDGSIIDSSVIISCEFTEEVNSSTNLSVGDVTASELTVEILSTDTIQQDEVLIYSIVEDGVETPIGIFKAEKPTVATRTSMRFSAYDNIIKTEKLFSDWLRNNQSQFPMTLLQLVQRACDHCAVTLVTTDFPHADLSVGAFYADDITCRQILAWAAAIAGRFVKANTEGGLEFAWYGDTQITTIAPSASAIIDVSDDGEGNVSVQSNNLKVTDDGEGNVTLLADGLSVTTTDDGITLNNTIAPAAGAPINLTDDGAGHVSIRSRHLTVTDGGEGDVTLLSNGVQVISNENGVTLKSFPTPFLRDKLSYESYTTDLIERVQINSSDDDVGVIYPEDATGNCFTISGNMILGVVSGDDIATVAQSIYEQLKSMTYVPFNVTVPRTILIRAGDKITVTDAEGNAFDSYVMKASVTPNGTTLSATGDKSYGSNAAVSSEKYTNLTGKLLSIRKSIDGLEIKNEDLTGKVGALELSTESFKTYVEESFVSGDNFEKYKSESEQTAKDITQKFESLDQYKNETSAHIKTGLLDYTDDNVPVYGMEIGQRTEVDGEEIFDKYARFTAEKLSFFDQAGNEITQIGDKKMSVTNVEITGSHDGGNGEYGTFKQGGFVDITLSDGSIVSKWVGGG